jgi:hypothetical protein
VSDAEVRQPVHTGWVTRERYELAAAWLLVAAVGVSMFYWLRDQPFYYDASGYMIESRGISDHGLLSQWPYSDIRSYGYPFFLTGALRIARLLHRGPHAGVFIAQWPLYVGSSWLATKCLFASRCTQLCAFVAIAANPLLVVYAPLAFTESLTLSCVLLATAALARATRSRGRLASAGWLVAGAAVSSYAVAVRPGSVLLPFCYAVAAGGVLLLPSGGRRWATALTTGGSVLVALMVPLLPQVLINRRHYGSSSPLPTYDLAGLQARAGMTIARYISNVAPCGNVGIKFPTPNPPPISIATNTLDAVKYYALSWPGGPEAVLLHVFSGLDPRPFLIDQHSFGAHYERALQALTVALLFLATAGLPEAVRRIRARRLPARIPVVFFGAVTLVFLGVLATSAAEYRFGSVPLITVSLLAVVGLSRLRRPSARTFALVGVSSAGALLLWVTLSDLLLSSSPIWQQCT